ncbi:MAG: DNA repair protein RecO [Coriobacteriales bacterium]|jgi:DNA repair protein RecO (recombination protein O)|nr:DNA repair protein RecO [Coriobacteriales bacterium]
MPSESATILVLRKTKLGETDLIITGFSDEGRQVRAVVKGGRKPGSRLGAHLELYSVARVLLHKGRSLHTVTEVSGLCSNEECRGDVLHSAAAAVVVELLDKVSMDGDTEPRLFPLAVEALRCVGAVPDEGVPLIAAATILKVASQLGFRPSLKECAFCGAPVGQGDGASGTVGDGASVPVVPSPPPAAASVAFSAAQGGCICAACLAEAAPGGCQTVAPSLIDWAEVLITSRFVELERYADAEHAATGLALLEFARDWLRAHLVPRLKSLDFLLSLNAR